MVSERCRLWFERWSGLTFVFDGDDEHGIGVTELRLSLLGRDKVERIASVCVITLSALA